MFRGRADRHQDFAIPSQHPTLRQRETGMLDGDGGSRRTVTSGDAAEPLSLGWLQPLGLLGLAAFNYMMRILTLGVYHFWGKTEVRKRIWSAVRIDGEPLEYTGTGRELMLGFMVIFGVVLLPALMLSFGVVVAFGPQSPQSAFYQAVFYTVFFLLMGVATYRAQRYRLARTRWRGIRGALVGSSWRYGLTHFWTGVLVPLTLGWIMPWRSVRLQRIVTRDMRFGDRPFTFTATAGPLYLRFALLWAGAIAIVVIGTSLAGGIVTSDLARAGQPGARIGMLSTGALVRIAAVALLSYLALAVVSAWYRASQMRHFAAHTQFAGARFRSTVTAGGLIWLSISNFVMVVLSVGLLVPVAQARSARYLVENLSIDGTVALGTISQGADQGYTRGEGLAQAFDVDAF